jgi:uncharacterized protein with HEPN domain
VPESFNTVTVKAVLSRTETPFRSQAAARDVLVGVTEIDADLLWRAATNSVAALENDYESFESGATPTLFCAQAD